MDARPPGRLRAGAPAVDRRPAPPARPPARQLNNPDVSRGTPPARPDVPRGTVSLYRQTSDERAAAARSRCRGRGARGARRRSRARTGGRRAGPAARPAPATSRGASVAREMRHVERQARSAATSLRRASPRGRADRHAVADGRARGLRSAGTPPSSRSARTSSTVRSRRSSASGIAGRPPPLPTSTTRAGWSSFRASANASGKCSLTSTRSIARPSG